MNEPRSVRIESIGPDDVRFADWYAAIRDAYAWEREPGWWESLPAKATYFARRPETRDRFVALLATADGTVVGGAELAFPLDAHSTTFSVELGILPGARRRGFGSALADAVRDEAHREGRELVQAEVYPASGRTAESWPGSCFARRHALRCVGTEHRFLLDLPFDETYLEPVTAGTEYTIVSWVGPCPDQHLAEWARLQTQMNEDVPVGQRTYTPRQVGEQQIRDSDRVMAEQGWTKVRSMALDSAGSGCGYTELFRSAHDEDVVIQDDTLVDRGHRGYGLGLRMKIANLRTLQQHDGGALLGARQRVQTYCAEDNHAMRHINAQLGFREVDVLCQFEGPTGHPTWS